jgi:CelD/BcsL family acetyltransferase involved in cellulose biosynthesis
MKSRRANALDLAQGDLAAWAGLLRASHPHGNAFLSPTFAQAAAKSHQAVEVCTITDGEDIAAILPYQFAGILARELRAAERVGEEMSDCFGLIARPDFVCTPTQILSWANLTYLYFTHLPARQLAHGLHGEKPQGGLSIKLQNGGAAYWQALQSTDGKFASDTERRERKAVREFGQMRFEFEDTTAGRLSELLRHKRAQYLRTGKGDWLAPRGRQALIETLAQSNAEDCRGTLSTLWFGETWAAMHFGLRSLSTLHYWFPVYNPELSQFAPGRLLLRNIILSAAANGITVIDRGLGESQAKQDFPSDRQLFYSGAWHRPGLRSLTYRALQSVRWRVMDPLTKFLRRKPPAPAPTVRTEAEAS